MRPLIVLLFLCNGIAFAAPPPNIIVFLADDMGMGDTSAYRDWTGNPEGEQLHTPAMDRLARMGMRFTDAHSPHSRCSPSRYALLNGRYCWRTRLKHRVPFIAAWPLGGVGDGKVETAGGTCARLLSLNDVYATVAEVIGKPLPPLKGKGRGAEDSISQLAAMRGEKCPPRPAVFPNDHSEASKKKSDERAVVAVRSNAAPLAGEWKLFLDHRFAFRGEIHPMELYNLADDRMEARNRLDDPECRPVLDFLIEQARLAAGDDGSTRHQR